MKICYSEDYVAARYAFDTTRKSQAIAESLRERPIPGVELVAPTPATVEQLCRAHERDYVEAVRTGTPRDRAQGQGFTWDPGLWTAVAASTGGVLAAARTAVSEGVAGSLSSGLHHAAKGRGAGFCTFNGLALAALDAVDGGARRVLIVDLDAHCGGGTWSIVAGEERVWQLDVAVSPVDVYAPTGHATLDLVTRARDYLPTIERRLRDLAPGFDVMLYNAGMDPYEGCAIGGMTGITRDVLGERERMVFEWAGRQGVPVAFVLAGGYGSEEVLVELHRMTISAAAGFTHGRRA